MPQTADDFFPPSPRVIYSKSPLVEVICQLRFPPILRIESSPPAEFQERIRQVFPLFEKDSGLPMPNIPPEIAKLIGGSLSGSTTNRFLSEDKTTFLNLNSESISLTTSNYTQWEAFKESLRLPLTALIDIYKPSFFTRIGLRYMDAVERDRLGLSGKKWSELLNPIILGELSQPAFEDNLLEEVQRIIRVKYPDGSGAIRLRHGLGQVGDNPETCYTIDFDFYVERRTEIKDGEAVLDRFNTRAGRAFRWCITDTLHHALGPSEI
jgi:uncharacterized protein (TIGR04255 family)